MTTFNSTIVKGPGLPHRCAAKRCRRVVIARFLMCLPHWNLVPAEVRERVIRYHRPGLPYDEQFEEYRVAVRHAIDHFVKRAKTPKETT